MNNQPPLIRIGQAPYDWAWTAPTVGLPLFCRFEAWLRKLVRL